MRGKEAVVEEINEDIDLSLSLSLNGRFGVDPQRNRKLTGAPSHLINPHQRQEVQSLAPMDANMRSLHSSRSSTISYFQNQIIEDNLIHYSLPYFLGLLEPAAAHIFFPLYYYIYNPTVITIANSNEFEILTYTTISGRKINGYLSKYNQEETRILCACHGFSMTPAEFIKHAGGGDVAFLERHITVQPVGGDGEVVNPHY
ncbi:ninja-family protein AFP3-like [Apium graveolens]|uniref:ninja-family protein AFP3-like n=1 Tax=Apium graveolens TaxID=4045 RepID=UPI003D79BF56